MDTSMLGRINALRQMTVAELQAEWLRLYGEPTRSRNRTYLWKRLAWRVQELEHGGLSEQAKERLEQLGQDGFVRARTPSHAPLVEDVAPPGVADVQHRRRDPRLPVPGSVITKNYKGRVLRAVIRDDGVEFDGAMHASLTALAKKITGCKSINGRLFWGLSQRTRKR